MQPPCGLQMVVVSGRQNREAKTHQPDKERMSEVIDIQLTWWVQCHQSGSTQAASARRTSSS